MYRSSQHDKALSTQSDVRTPSGRPDPRISATSVALNAAPRATQLVRNAQALNRGNGSVVQRADDLDLDDEDWLNNWYEKRPEQKRMTPGRKFSQIINTLRRQRDDESGGENDGPLFVGAKRSPAHDIPWDAIKGRLLEALMAFQVHIAPYNPRNNQGRDRIGGSGYMRSNEHHYHTILKEVASKVPTIRQIIDEQGKTVHRMINVPYRKSLPPPSGKVKMDDLHIDEDSGLSFLKKDQYSAQNDFASLAILSGNFKVLEKIQELIEENSDQFMNDPKLLDLLFGQPTNPKEGTGRSLTGITPQKAVAESLRKTLPLAKQGTEENFHDFMLGNRGDLTDSIGDSFKLPIPDKKKHHAETPTPPRYSRSGVEQHPSLLLHDRDIAENPTHKKKKMNVWMKEMSKDFGSSPDKDTWPVNAEQRDSFGFVRPTLARMIPSLRVWPGYTPKSVFMSSLGAASSQSGYKPPDDLPDDTGEPQVHVEALKVAVRHAAIALSRGSLQVPPEKQKLLNWLLTRLTINLEKARFLLSLYQNSSAEKPLNLGQHYLKSADVIDNLQEYSFLFTALTFDESRQDDPTSDPYLQHLEQQDVTKEQQVAVFYLDSGMQALNTASLIVRQYIIKQGKAEKSKGRDVAPFTRYNPYYEEETVRSQMGVFANRKNSPDLHMASVDMSPVLKDSPTTLSQKEANANISKTIGAPNAIPVFDLTNDKLSSVKALVDKHSGLKQFIVIESLVKHTELGSDKYLSGRLVVVGDGLVPLAHEIAGPIEQGARHPLVNEYRRNMDEAIYGDHPTAGPGSQGALSLRRQDYTAFVHIMGLGEEWEEAQDDPATSQKLLHQAMEDYVTDYQEMVREMNEYDFPYLDPAYQSLPRPDQMRLSGRVTRALTPQKDVKMSSGQDESGGIRNVGNTCYLSSVLNLMAFSGYADILAQAYPPVDMEEENPSPTDPIYLGHQLGRILARLKAGQAVGGGDVASLLETLDINQLLPSVSAEDMEQGIQATEAQHDPHELLGKIVQFLDLAQNLSIEHETTVRVSDPQTGTLRPHANPQDYSDLDAYGQITRSENHWTLTLPVEGCNTLQQMLMNYMWRDSIDDLSYVHQGVVRQKSARKKVALRSTGQLPQVITVVLGRWNGIQKDDTQIRMPQTLSFGQRRYRLNAVVFHHGASPLEGHYTTTTRNDDGTWMDRNDSTVTKRTKGVQSSREGYIYTYTLDATHAPDDKKDLNIQHPDGIQVDSVEWIDDAVDQYKDNPFQLEQIKDMIIANYDDVDEDMQELYDQYIYKINQRI